MIGKAIKAARARRDLTQEQLAEMIGVEQGTLARYESEQIQPPLQFRLPVERVHSIHRVVRLDELLGI